MTAARHKEWAEKIRRAARLTCEPEATNLRNLAREIEAAEPQIAPQRLEEINGPRNA